MTVEDKVKEFHQYLISLFVSDHGGNITIPDHLKDYKEWFENVEDIFDFDCEKLTLADPRINSFEIPLYSFPEDEEHRVPADCLAKFKAHGKVYFLSSYDSDATFEEYQEDILHQISLLVGGKFEGYEDFKPELGYYKTTDGKFFTFLDGKFVESDEFIRYEKYGISNRTVFIWEMSKYLTHNQEEFLKNPEGILGPIQKFYEKAISKGIVYVDIVDGETLVEPKELLKENSLNFLGSYRIIRDMKTIPKNIFFVSRDMFAHKQDFSEYNCKIAHVGNIMRGDDFKALYRIFWKSDEDALLNIMNCSFPVITLSKDQIKQSQKILERFFPKD